MAKMGRPKLGRGKQKQISLYVRVTPAEKRLLDAAAKIAKTRLSTWARNTLLVAAGAPS
jgi:uncharacterized protein (DUF1778 family)